MAFGSKCVAKNIRHDDLVERIRKTFYYGDNHQPDFVEENLTLPLASYASELFSKSHEGYSLNRLSTYNAAKIQANPCSLIMAIIFLERLNADGSDSSYVHRITPQELFIVSMMISTKFYVGHDEEVYLSDWAAEGNMTDERLKQLELEFLCAIDWNIYISKEEFFAKLDNIEKILAAQQGLSRGWLTYTELERLLPSNLIDILRETTVLLNFFAVLAVSYAAGILTIVGAFFLASNVPGHALHRSVSTPATGSANLTNLSSRTEVQLNTSTVTPISKENSTSCAINTEAELLKLEHQYQQEQHRHRNNEMNQQALNLLLPFKLMSQTRDFALSKRSEHKWLTFKEMYSESESSCSSNKQNFNVGDIWQTNRFPLHPKQFEHQKNITNAFKMFWQTLADTATKTSIVRLPYIWFKFI